MVELESEGELTRGEVALFLREFASEIDESTFDREQGHEVDREEVTDDGSLGPKRVTLIVGGDSATVTVPETVDFDIEIESRSPMLRTGVHQELEFELSWEIENPDGLGDDRIAVE
jgi:amphi-Trp domain-containing protein